MIILLVEGNITNELGCVSHLVSSPLKYQDSLTPKGPQGCCFVFFGVHMQTKCNYLLANSGWRHYFVHQTTSPVNPGAVLGPLGILLPHI